MIAFWLNLRVFIYKFKQFFFKILFTFSGKFPQYNTLTNVNIFTIQFFFLGWIKRVHTLMVNIKRAIGQTLNITIWFSPTIPSVIKVRIILRNTSHTCASQKKIKKTFTSQCSSATICISMPCCLRKPVVSAAICRARLLGWWTQTRTLSGDDDLGWDAKKKKKV